MNFVLAEVEGRVKILDSADNALTSKDEGSGIRSLDANIRSGQVRLVDALGNVAKITASGDLRVVTPPPETPVDGTRVDQVAYSDVSNTSDTVFVIPSGEVLTIQRVAGGAASSNGGSVIELWYDSLGTGVSMVIIAVVFANGSGGYQALQQEYTGDGTKRIVLRRRRLDGGAKLMFARWEGYTV